MNASLQYLLPDHDEGTLVQITQIRVPDKGSKPQTVRVVVAWWTQGPT